MTRDVSPRPALYAGRGRITENFKKWVLDSHKGQFLAVLHAKWGKVGICVFNIVIRIFRTFCHCSTCQNRYDKNIPFLTLKTPLYLVYFIVYINLDKNSHSGVKLPLVYIISTKCGKSGEKW